MEALRFGFDVTTRGTLADGAGLEIIDIPGAAWCSACACEVPAPTRYEPCPRCGGYQLRITAGEELRIKELEVE